MFYKSLYYTVKPIIPRWFQIQIRRQIIRRKRKKYSHIWPIDERAAKPPEGWAGWPEGKKFALVLTHDVETIKGVERVTRVAELEKGLGFRSSFNFIAEEYSVPHDLIKYLKDEGFEVGLHGLNHNGNLFESKKKFQSQASRINQYLKAWGVTGFRTPIMYHNLEWMHDLNIEYDSSTFDIDPFEPQPDGMKTIFPFWVSGKDGQRGYVELPYTVPQDFTLFILMGEKDIEIWKKKVDWIAENGGMALLITHPDYIDLANNNPKTKEYPGRYYEELLTYIKQKYDGQYWHVMPREMAKFLRENHALQKVYYPPVRTGLRVCMLSYSFYENDGRVKRYAEALADRGDRVDVIALKRNGQNFFEIQNGVNVYRIQERASEEKSKFSYLNRLIRFLLHSSYFLTKEHLKKRYQLIHVHSIPDFEVFAAFFAKLSGTKVILDIHDIIPELYASKFSRNGKGRLFKALVAMEKASARFVDHVIISNHIWEQKILSRSVTKDKCSVVLNYPDQSIFFSRPKSRNDDKFIMMYPGTLNWHQGLDLAIKALSQIKNEVPNTEFHIYGRGRELENLKKLANSLNVSSQVLFKPPLPIELIAELMANADLGVVPKRNDPFGGEAFSTKILEFMAVGVPVIVSETKIDRYYFNDSVVKFFKPGDENDLARCMLSLIQNKEGRDSLATDALKFVQDFTWDKKEHEYLDLVDRLVNS